MATLTNQTRAYTSFGGCDINMVVENVLIGNAAGVTFSVTREKAPVYVMGS